jgi:hypothetical protein
MSELHLKKLLTTVLKEKYPDIEEIRISEEYNEAYSPPKKEYIIYIGMTYSNMVKLDGEEVKSEARNISRYVIDFPREIVRNVFFFDPDY